MEYTGGSWQVVGSAGFSAGAAYYTSLAIDPSSGIPYVAYEDGANANKDTVMEYTLGSWSVVGSAGISAGTAQYISLAASSGILYVAYEDGANGNKATVMEYN
jgi:hypothetical protein